MFKKALFAAIFFSIALTNSASANCDLSVANFQKLAQNDLDTLYTYNSFNLKKPILVVSNQKGLNYYAEQLGSVITIYPKSFNDAYCDQYFDGLTPAVAEAVSHEYVHYLDGKLDLSKKIGEQHFSENTAELGEHVFDTLIWHTGFYTEKSSQSAQRKFDILLAKISKPLQ